MSCVVDTRFLQIQGERKVAYKKTIGPSSPTIVFAPGFMSNMSGRKATTLQKFCLDNSLSCVRFDYEGVGESPGDVKKLHLRHWMEDLKYVIEKLTSGPVLLVGSSLGGWISISVAQKIPERIWGMVLVAPALNFFVEKYHFIYNGVSPEQRAILDSGENLLLNGPYGEIFIRKEFSEQSREEHINLSKPIPLKMPIRLIHGVLDPDVPYKRSLQLAPLFESDDVDVILRKNGEHQMSEEADLALLLSTINLLITPITFSKL
ncbi:palmitoyl-protein thioesterase ABHD10, mitochondrial-like [Hetaerina americana]|uniref:palmitoyl-protein thioesterase ABHD10, mitochondrial-like n=1 Tax=Hetaerina americana TaxID=62018 RepID=UPI003A7F4A5E